MIEKTILFRKIRAFIYVRTYEQKCHKNQYDFYPFFCVTAIDWILGFLFIQFLSKFEMQNVCKENVLQIDF